MFQMGRDWFVWWEADAVGLADDFSITTLVDRVRSALLSGDPATPSPPRTTAAFFLSKGYGRSMDWPGGQ